MAALRGVGTTCMITVKCGSPCAKSPRPQIMCIYQIIKADVPVTCTLSNRVQFFLYICNGKNFIKKNEITPDLRLHQDANSLI
uniref:Uncharacterized protein n=1 Tax=Oryza glumipatula TaxID=40148 RepID=A0A0D9ZJR3_9ORYZ